MKNQKRWHDKEAGNLDMSPKDPEKSPYQARLASKLFKQLRNPCLPPQLPYCPDGKAMTPVELYRKSTVAMFRIHGFSNIDMPRFPNEQHITHQRTTHHTSTINQRPWHVTSSSSSHRSETAIRVPCLQAVSFTSYYFCQEFFHLVQSQTTVFTMP